MNLRCKDLNKSTVLAVSVVSVSLVITVFFLSGFLAQRWVEIGRIQFRVGDDGGMSEYGNYGIARFLPTINHKWRVKITTDAYKGDELCSVSIGYSSSPSTKVLPSEYIQGSSSITREFDATGTFTLFVVASYPQTLVTVIIEEYK